MREKSLLRVATLITLFSLTACHTMRFEITNEATETHQRKTNHFFLWGLVPTRNIDLARYCPNGTGSIIEDTTFLNVFCGAITLGIWAPRSATFYCIAPESLHTTTEEL